MDITDYIPYLSGYSPYLTINGVSHHGDAPEYAGMKWNEDNGGAGITFKKRDGDIIKALTGGYYKNSYGDDTLYGGGSMQKRIAGDDRWYVDLGGRAGVATGYKYPLVPMLQPMLTIGLDGNVDMNIGYQPHIQDIAPEAWMLNFDYRLK